MLVAAVGRPAASPNQKSARLKCRPISVTVDLRHVAESVGAEIVNKLPTKAYLLLADSAALHPRRQLQDDAKVKTVLGYVRSGILWFRSKRAFPFRS